MVKIADLTTPTETMPPRRDDGAWAILFNNEHKFLIAKRTPVMRHPNLWNFFGGSIDRKEDPITAAIRELAEETRLHIKPDRLIRSEKLENPERTHYFFVFDYTDEKFRLNWENSDPTWVTAAELKNMLEVLHKPTRLFVENFL
jgi:8-oxo-dGTP diphosphatase